MRSRSIIIAALLTACTGPAANNGTPPEKADSGAVADALAAAQCEKILECCTPTELESVFAGQQVAGQQDCVAAVRAQADAFFVPALDAAQDAESVVVHTDELDSCTGALRARSCGSFRPTASLDVLAEPACNALVEPTLTLSAFCAEDFECETGFCSRPPGETEGTCKNPPAAGEACLSDRCGDGLFCATDGTCTEKLGDGAECGRNAECRSDSCAPDEQGVLVCQTAPDICTG